MKRRKRGFGRRIGSISLAIALVVTSLQVTVNPQTVKRAEAASVSSTMETRVNLSATHVKDSNVLKFYKILANAQKMGKASELSGKTASEILSQYTSSDYTQDVYGTYLTEFSGDINFSGLTISNVDGIGWARAATSIDLSGATFTSPLTEVPANEFAACREMTSIKLPSGITKIGNNAFESCVKLKTLQIGETGEENVIDLTKVDEVGASAFRACSSIENVKFASFGTRSTELVLGTYAFAACSKLKAIEIPIKTAANLGASAFENCSSLAEVGLMEGIGALNNAVFKGVGYYDKDRPGSCIYTVFYRIGAKDLQTSKLPVSITTIGDNCFEGASLKDMDLSQCTKLTVINQYGFATINLDNTLESTIVLPDSLEKLETMAFSAAGLLQITIPEKCLDIGKGAFGRSTLVSVRLPKGLKEIKEGTFSECHYLQGSKENFIIPDSSELETIGKDAFRECWTLTTTEFLKDLKKLTTIEEGAFAECYYIDKNSTNQSELTNLWGDKRVLFGLREIILPDCVKTLGESVFEDDYALRTADLGSGIVHLPNKAFYNTKETASKSGAGLEKVIVSGELDSIGEQAFANQSRLHTIGYHDGNKVTVEEGVAQFKDGLLTIGDKAFYGCGIQSTVNAAGAIAYVEKGAIKDTHSDGMSKFLFYDYENCEKKDNFCRVGYLDEKKIASKSKMAEDGDFNTFMDTLTSTGREKYDKVYLVAKEVYVNDEVFHNYPENTTLQGVEILENYELYDTETTAYENRLFYIKSAMRKRYCSKENADSAVSKEPTGGNTSVWTKVLTSSGIKNVAVENVETKSYAINYAFGLKDVVIPNSVINDNLGQGAFEKCINLNKVELSENLTEIKDSTFSGAGQEITNPISSEEKDRYFDYYGLRTVTIPDGVTNIGKNAFKGCYNLLLTKKGGSSFGTSVETIDDYAFSECRSLSSVFFPSSLKKIGTEAFSKCAVQEKDDWEIKYKNSDKSYKFKMNYETYGKKTTREGLKEIDFTAATSLESVGAGAFMQTNVKKIDMTESPLVVIPNNLFKSCTFLQNVSFQSKTESLGENVLQDNVKMASVTIPARATIKKNSISGAYGEIVDNGNPTLVLDYDKTEQFTVPINSSLRLPINVINKDVINGDIKISADFGNGTYQDILGKSVSGLSAEVNTKDDPYSFILYGSEYITKPITVRVETGMGFQYAESGEYWLSSHTMDFQVMVKDLPTEEIHVSAAEDKYVKANPSMYVEKGSDKTLFIPLGKDASKNGVTLTANLLPLETTEDVTWSSDNPAITISDEKYEKGTGLATAVIKTTEIGDAKVTVTSGTKSDTIYVYSVIPVVAGGLTCTTGGTFLGVDLKPNSASSPYGLSIGDTDKLNISLNYGNTDYTEEQLSTYGEKIVFSSSDESVISINEDGTFKALAEGTAVITVTAQGSGTKIQFYFDIADGANYIPASIKAFLGDKELGKDDAVVVNTGESVSLSAKVTPTKASQEVTWSVTNGKDVIKIDDTGKVTGLKTGTAKVVATSKVKDSVKSAEVTIQVSSPATGLKILNGDVTLEIGKTLQISKTTKETEPRGYYITPVDTTDTITWTSNNEAVVSVTNSSTQSVTVKAVAAGTAVLTGTTSSGISASITITVPVPQIKVNGITVDKAVTLNVGGAHQLNPQITPADANESITYTYTSSKADVATVDASGLIRAVAPGSASIQVRTSTGKTASCSVTVKQPANKVTLLVNKPSFKKIYMAKGQNVTLKAKVTPENTTDTITWKSNKAKIAAVNANGVVTAKKKGTAKITATATSGKKATITVIVQKKQVKAKKVTLKAKTTMKRKKTMRVTVSLKSAKSTDTLSFSSNKPAVAKVDAYGYVTALKKGKVKITVTASSGKKATKTIKVK